MSIALSTAYLLVLVKNKEKNGKNLLQEILNNLNAIKTKTRETTQIFSFLNISGTYSS